MTRERDAKIAEWCGWRTEERKLKGSEKTVTYYISPDGEYYNSICAPYYPEYSTDLNAMARAEAVVRERGFADEYADVLWGVVIEDISPPITADAIIFSIATATAQQRAEALRRMIDYLDKVN